MKPAEHSIQVLTHAGGVVRAIQLTDTHLCAEAGGTLLAMDTDHSLASVIRQVRAQRGSPDLVLGTGDLADGGARGAYRRLRGYLDGLCEHSFCLPGNHDSRPLMAAELGEFPCLAGEVQVANWQVLLLDSQVPGEVGGTLGEGQLDRLRDGLARAADSGMYSLVCLHHHPRAIGSAWLDEQMVSDADAFFAILEQFPGARGVLWGHIHQQIDDQVGQLKLMSSPSTCVQFAPGSEHFRADSLAPGYRWLDLHPDGRIETGVVRVEGEQFTVDLDSGGYL